MALLLTPSLRKLALTAHVISSVGWFGAVGGFLALGVAGLTTRDAQMVNAAYLAMEVTAWFVIVPLAFASLLTGLVVSLSTHGGLFRHYWVLLKLVLTSFATLLLLVHMRTISALAAVVRGPSFSAVDVGQRQVQVVGDAGAALLALIVATALGVYKPRGMTPYGRRKQHEERNVQSSDVDSIGDIDSPPRWVKVSGIIGIVLILLFRIVKALVAGYHP
jgi:hypothetical protein